jgi:hypothetical protein
MIREIEQAGLRIIADTIRRNCAIVPVIRQRDVAETERIRRPRRQYRSRTLPLIDKEGFAIASTTDLEVLTASHEFILPRIQREQDAHATVRIRVQDDQIAVLLRSNIDACKIAPIELRIRVQPHLHRRIRFRQGHRGLAGGGGQHQRDQQGDHYAAS